MKRTLLLTLDFPPMVGGVANYWKHLCSQLPPEDLVVLAPECDQSFDFDSQQRYLIYRKNLFHQCRWIWPNWLPFMRQAFKITKREKIQHLLVAQVLPGGTIAYCLKKHYNIPYTLSFHGLDLAFATGQPRKHWLLKKIIENASSIIVNSQYTKDLLLSRGYKFAGPLEVIYPCPNITPAVCPLAMREKIKFNDLKNKKVIVTVARLVERKGQDNVLRALPQVIQEVPNLKYLIVGNGVYKDRLVSLIRELHLEQYVNIIDDALDEELPCYFELADVFVMPCRRLDNGDVEGFGIVFLEANAFGKPVIAGRSGGAVEAVDDSKTGFLVDPQNVNEIANSIINLLKNPQLAQKIGQNGKNRVEKIFLPEKQVKKLLKLLK